MARKVYYTEHKDYPAATSVSRTINVAIYFIGFFFVSFTVFAFLGGGIICIFVGVVLFFFAFFLKVIEGTIISLIVKHSTPLSSIQIVAEAELKKARAYKKKAEYFLSLSPLSKELKEEATLCEMTTSEYRKYCREIIANYDDIKRQYNLTHYPPVQDD